MTIREAWQFVKQRESQGRLDAIGDDGRAGGAGQMWWVFRKTYWPAWCWRALEVLDGVAFEAAIKRHSPVTSLRDFYEHTYNPHSSAPELPTEAVEELW